MMMVEAAEYAQVDDGIEDHFVTIHRNIDRVKLPLREISSLIGKGLKTGQLS